LYIKYIWGGYKLLALIIVGFSLFYNVEHIKAQEVIPGILVVSALSDDTLYYKENYLLPTIGNKTGIVKRKRPNNTIFENNKLKVYPNPANDYVIVEYQLVDETDKAVVKIIDNNGFIRQTIAQENNHGFMVIDTRDLETGTYICHVAASGKLVGVAKFIIFK